MNGENKNKVEVSPQSYFNLNHADLAIKALLSNKGFSMDIPNREFSDIVGSGRELVVTFNGTYFAVIRENSWALKVGQRYLPFDIFAICKFGRNYDAADGYVRWVILEEDSEYIRVGVKYYKIIVTNDRYDIERKEVVIWNKEEIRQDFGKESLKYVRKFERFTISPNNLEYTGVVGRAFNMYSAFPHKPKPFKDKEQIKWSLTFLEHIFGEQFELGLLYMRILYQYPKQPLPILVLVSEDRSTGKSTFIDWLSIIFGANMVIVNPQNMSSEFNEGYGLKNIIAIEESKFENTQTMEKLKSISTAKMLNINPKGTAHYQVPFYGKLIITSNDEDKFSRVDEKEIRYWTRKIPVITEGNHSILEDLRNEIPVFLDYLLTQVPEVDFSRSRQVFTPEEISTDTLLTVKRESRSGLHKEIEELLDDWMLNNEHYETLIFTPKDIKDIWFSRDSKISISYIRQVLMQEMKLEQWSQRRYTPFFNDDSPHKPRETKGRPFGVANNYYKESDETKDVF